MGNYKDYYRLGFIHHLKNVEFSNIFLDLTLKIDKTELSDEHFLNVLSKAKSHIAFMSEFGEDSYKHPLTKVIREQTAKRRNLLRSIRRFAEAAILTEGAEAVVMGEKIILWMEPHFKSLYQASSKQQKNTVLRLQETMQKGKVKGVEEALEALGCDKLFTEIISLTESIDEMRDVRSDDFTEMKRELQRKRQDAFEDLNILLSTLFNFSKVSGPNQDVYISLSKRIKTTIIEYSAELQSRKTQARNRKDAETGEDVQDEATQSDTELGLSDGASEAADETKIADDNAPAING